MKIFGNCKICNKQKELRKYKEYDPMCAECATKMGLTKKHQLVFQEMKDLKFDDDKPTPKVQNKKQKTPTKAESKVDELIKENAKLQKQLLDLEEQLDHTTKQLFYARNNSSLKDKIVEKLKAEINDLERQVDRLEKTVEIYKKGEIKCQKK